MTSAFFLSFFKNWSIVDLQYYINFRYIIIQWFNSFIEYTPFLEKEMATHSSTLAWKIPWTEEPGELQSMGSQRVRHDWATLLTLFTFLHWRGKWQPTPVFLPTESHGQRSLVSCSPWGRKESDWSNHAHAHTMLGESQLSAWVLSTVS